MSNSNLSQKEQEELNKLEHEAIIELYQIIALAHQTQDIDYLDSMISAWKYKYRKVLENPSPDFRKKLERLLNESYSKVVEYILSQIKLKEEKKIENQRKALRELYGILSDNYDYDLVMDKIKKWENKYPYDSFLKMYQKRIDSIKREKNIEQYAFKQEEAFKDLYYGVVNRSGTIEELQDYLHKWEEKYYINDRFTIDHFIKHQTEVKRYTSDEFLISIAKKDEHILDEPFNRISDSSLSVQDFAYKKLESIVKGKHSIDQVFKWVYDNNSIKFNDFYKQRIINAISLEYSPKYLKSLPEPDIDLTKPALPIEQYKKISEIKRYAILSYFNLLLPHTEAISNNFFTENIKTIYYESERSKHSNIISTFKDEVTNFVPESLNKQEDSDLTLDLKNINTSNDKNSEKPNVEDVILDIEKLITTKKEPELVSSSENSVPLTGTQKIELEYTLEEPDIAETFTSSESMEPLKKDSTDTKELKTESVLEKHNTIEIITSSELSESLTQSTSDSQEVEIKYTLEEPNSVEIVISSEILEPSEKDSADTKKLEIEYTSEEPVQKPTQKTLSNNNITVTSNVNSSDIRSVENDLVKEESITYNTYTTDIDKTDSLAEKPNQSIDYDTIISFSPSFFEAINNYSIQANLVQTASHKFNQKTYSDKINTNHKTRNQQD